MEPANNRKRPAGESEGDKEARLAKRRERDRARKALPVTAETQVEKATRLKRKSTAQQQRLAAQNPD